MTPQTASGRALLAVVPSPGGDGSDWWGQKIAAIEAEARSGALAEAARAVEGLPKPSIFPSDAPYLKRAAVLARLAEPKP